MKLPELTYDLLETVRNARIVDDDNLSHRLLAQWIHTYRAKWCGREFNLNREIDDNLLQDILTDVEFVDKSLDPELASYNLTGKIYRTKLKIPALVDTHTGLALLEIRFPELMSYHINVVPLHQFAVSGSNRFTSRQVFATLRDHYFYFKFGKDNLAPIMKSCVIRGVFQTPTEVPNYDFNTSTYPLNRYIWEMVKKEILQSDLNIAISSRSDEVNDGSGIIK